MLTSELDTVSDDISTDRALWRAVLAQSFTDATMRSGDNRSGTERLEKRRAIEFLTKPSAWFEEVCEMAGLCPRQVRALAVAKIEQSNAPGWSRILPKRQGTGVGQRRKIAPNQDFC